MTRETVYIGIGTNLGEREANLDAALEALEALACRPLRRSPTYETEPRLDLDQPAFFNLVVELETELSPGALLDALLETERDLGRVRDQGRPKGPRLVDLDIVLFGDQIVDTPELTIPHPAMAERRFVLRPLVDLAPLRVHPQVHLTMTELLARCPDEGWVAQLPPQPQSLDSDR